MPVFYFDLVNGFHSTDQQGTELPSVIHARIEAVKFAGSYLTDEPELVWDGSELRVLVFGEDRTLLTIVLITASNTQAMNIEIDAEEERTGTVGQNHAAQREVRKRQLPNSRRVQV